MQVQRSPNSRDPRKTPPSHIIIKMAKIKDMDRVLKEARERKKITYKGRPIRISADVSAANLHARKEWHDIFNEMKQGLQPRILSLERLSLKFEAGIKQYSDKKKLREFTFHKPSLQSILKGLLQRLNSCHERK